MKTPHKLRNLSNLAHSVAMLPFVPLCIARPLAKIAGRFYYASPSPSPSRIKPALILAAQVFACGLLGLAFVAGAVLLRELTR